ncbi:unnamed protein product, partial [Rotaria socialis]
LKINYQIKYSKELFKSLTFISIFLHLNIKYSGTIRIRDEQQFVPFKLDEDELGDCIDEALVLT